MVVEKRGAFPPLFCDSARVDAERPGSAGVRKAAQAATRCAYHGRQEHREAPMRGLMMDRPLLLSALLEHAGECHGSTEIAARDFDGTIFRYDYAAARMRAKQLAQAIGALGPGNRGARHRAGRARGHARLELPPPLRDVLRRLGHRCRAPHHQSPPAPRPAPLHHRPLRRFLAVLRSRDPVAGGEPRTGPEERPRLLPDGRRRRSPEAHVATRAALL